MHTSLIHHAKQSYFVPTNLSAMAVIDCKRVSMRVEEIDRAGLFLISREYVQPWTLFELEVILPGDTLPIYALVTASFIEQTWEGYGIGVQISSISSAAQQRFETYYYKHMAAGALDNRSTFRLERFIETCHIVAMRDALPERVCMSLRELGVEVKVVDSTEEAIELVLRGVADLVVSSIAEGHYAGVELCRRFSEQQRRPMILLLSQITTFRSFNSSLYAGATKVLAWPCSLAMLVTRIVALLQDRQSTGGSIDANPGLREPPMMGALFEELPSIWEPREA